MSEETASERRDDRKDEMSDRMAERFETDTDETTETTDSTDTGDITADTDTGPADDGSRPKTLVREDYNRRTFMLDDETVEQIDSKYIELNGRYYAEHGEELPKSKVYYPALFEAVDWDELAEIVGLE